MSFEEKWINGINTLISIGYWRKNFRLFIENISAILNEKWIPCVHRNLLSKKVSGEASYFQHFWTLNKKSYPFVKIVKKIVWRSCQNCSLRVRRTILGEKIHWKTVIFSQIWTLSNNFWPFVEVLVEVVKKFQLWVCICGRSWIFKRLSFFFITFRTLREYFSLLSEKLQHGRRNCILFVLHNILSLQKKIWKRNEGEIKIRPFWNIGRKNSNFLTKTLATGFQNCIPRLHLKLS